VFISFKRNYCKKNGWESSHPKTK